MRLSGVRLRVRDPAGMARFYEDHFGMRSRAGDQGWRVGYGGEDADLVLLPGGGGYVADRGQRYWKIGITVPDLDAAHERLRNLGLDATEPHQFGQIGYMCHARDPAGFAIELLQWDFQHGRSSGEPGRGDPFARARIGQITLRSGDIAADQAVCRDLGMRLLSIQDVPDHGFDLHFLAFTDETPPEPDLWSVTNREWLWRRPYTTLEFQHIPGGRFARVPDFQGIEVEGLPAGRVDAHGDPVIPA